MIDTRMKKINSISKFLIFLKGYLNEYDMIFAKSTKIPPSEDSFIFNLYCEKFIISDSYKFVPLKHD